MNYLYSLRRYLTNSQLKTVAEGIFVSKLRYCLSLYWPIRHTEDDPRPSTLKDINVAYNKVLRLLTGNKLVDKISIKNMPSELNWLSLNQLCAKMRLEEAWKSQNIENYPLLGVLEKTESSILKTRSSNTKIKTEMPTRLNETSFTYPTAKLWNRAPALRTTAKNIVDAKTQIDNYVKKLPL